MIPYDPAALTLLHEGSLALAQVEAAGVRIDTEYLKGTIAKTEKKIARMEAELTNSDVIRLWRKTFGAKTNLQSGTQLGRILFDEMKLPVVARTETNKPKTDDESLEATGHPFCKKYLEIKKLRNAKGTFMEGPLRETIDGFAHCFYNLNIARTYRSTCDHFNFQNLPVRDPVIGPLVRRMIIPRRGRRIVEVDLKMAEVRVAACYNKDLVLIEYCRDDTKDMHFDMAKELFLLSAEEVSKPIRYTAKSAFVFAEFYGDYFIQTSLGLWKEVAGLKTAVGEDIYQHLANKGIKELGDLDPRQRPRKGTFEAHVKTVEDNFWNVRFAAYTAWKKSWYQEYLKRGFIKMLTGFVCQDYMSRNQVINSPIQGSAFHIILWVLKQLILKEMKKRKMQTLIVGQVHDSIVADVTEDEFDDFIELCRIVITEKLLQYWPWIIVPIKIEVEASPVDGSWAEKAPLTKVR